MECVDERKRISFWEKKERGWWESPNKRVKQILLIKVEQGLGEEMGTHLSHDFTRGQDKPNGHVHRIEDDPIFSCSLSPRSEQEHESQLLVSPDQSKM